MAQLRFSDKDGRLQTKALDAEHFVIGRADTCQLVLDDDMISREHIRIDLEREGRYRIRDLGSRNKTYVNGEQITETLLNSGDVIRVGDHVFEYVDESGKPERIDMDFLTPDRTEPGHCDWVKTKAPLSLTHAQVEQLTHLLSDLPLTARAEDVADAGLAQLLLDIQAERGCVALRGDGKSNLLPIAHRGLRRPPGGSLMPASQWFVFAPILQNVAGRYPQSAGQIDPKQGFAATAIVVPLTCRGETIGVLYVDRPASRKAFTPQQLQYAAAAGAHLGVQIAECSRALVRTAVREGAAWLTTLRRVHGALTVPVESDETFDVAGRVYAGRARCGDFVDVVHFDGQRCCGIVVDGGGHGITGLTQACAVRMAVRAALSVEPDALSDPTNMFNTINRMVAELPTRQILPCTYIGIDLAAGKLSYINAGGMPPLLMVGPGRLVTLDQPSLVLGVDPEYLYEMTRVDLSERFRVVVHTDGLVEGSSAGGEALGDQRLHEILLDRDSFVPAKELADRIHAAWNTHMGGGHPDDDAAFLVISRE